MTKRLLLALLCALFVGSFAFAGDVATFVNLGFSPDSRTFMFSQYWIDSTTSKPAAEIYVVDVPDNSFVPNGVKNATFDQEINPGQDGRGGMYILLEQNAELVASQKIDHLSQGRIVYLLLDGETPKSHVEFRDFETGNRYSVDLVQEKSGSEKEVSASFHLQVRVFLAGGGVKAYTVGRPGYKRAGVSAYRIREIILSPDERSLIFVMEKERPTDGGKSIRYMVETVSIK